MTTSTFSSFLDNTSTTGFRAWGSELSSNFAAVGMIQTSDTGQINWTTVTIPVAINTAAGYEIWKFSDSSLFVKWEYGTGSSTTNAQIWMTWGTGSNGSGTITGQTSTRSTMGYGTNPNSTTTAYPSYMCATANAFSLVWKIGAGAGTNAYGFACVGKTVDATGTPNMNGFGVLRSGASSAQSTLQSVKLTSVAATNTDSPNYIVFPGNPSSSQTGTNVQAYLCWLNVHQVAPFAWACGYLLTEQLKLTPFSFSVVSTPSHTYLPLGGLAGALNGQSATTYSLAFIYE